MDQTAVSSREAFANSFDRVGMAARRAGAFRLTDVEPTGIQWLWPGRIPLGYVTLLVSDPGAGKSLLALDIAARITTGRLWPDENDETRMTNEEPPAHSSFETDNPQSSAAAPANPQSTIRNPQSPGSVLLVNIEDHFHNTIRPRLEALGADCSRILGLSHVPGEGVFTIPRPVAIDRDINRLEMLIREIPDCRLIILDPITAFFGDTSTRSTGNIWKVLSNLAWLAASANLAVLAISHLRKKEGAAIHRALGSMAFVAAARAVWTIATDPADASRRLFLPLKNNLADSAKGLAFTIESDPSNGGPVVRWLPETIDARADAVLASNHQPGRPDDERRFAIDWLRERLANRPLPSREVRKAADAHGISAGTMRRAFRELGAVAFQPNNVLHGPWMWKLPGSDAQKPQGEFCASDPLAAELSSLVSK